MAFVYYQNELTIQLFLRALSFSKIKLYKIILSLCKIHGNVFLIENKVTDFFVYIKLLGLNVVYIFK